MTEWTRERAIEVAVAAGHVPLDLSLGVPGEPPPTWCRAPESRAPAAYPASRGTLTLRVAAAGYLERRFGITVDADAVAASAGAKEFISTAPLFLRDVLAPTTRDTVLIPALGYPAYEVGARLAGLRAHRIPADEDFRMRLDRLPDAVAARALCVWVNSPANPSGVVEALGPIVRWACERGVLLLSDEAYAETTWSGTPRTALEHGPDGVLAVHSMSKRSNAPGLRVGFYAGDPAVVAGLVTRRRAAGFMASADAQAEAAALLDDDAHAEALRVVNERRLRDLVSAFAAHGLPCTVPEGGLFAWLPAPGADGAAFARYTAERAGLIVAAGQQYGRAGRGHVRIAATHDVAVVVPRLRLLRTDSRRSRREVAASGRAPDQGDAAGDRATGGG
ncbi:pyridoxal phosphate-dependent aminotransferase [Amycolatopsis sp. WQ 127309]|uniref:pyridoxal phosphate-dependent aminotransferase n=1 Tax=Amycolatopsis sp. WQ 127309 TaxID=2932773 RepID=UPI001FF180F7|nr:pyridoxal phosphate-dependent aminotransferase [Amycolatopsis sp. WQ 127309]UOZ07043.1 aminotransferase class I/II-fold pyridoxal phosphate-dependent enzyme [Amycolatopsis sp. WQ 127309]